MSVHATHFPAKQLGLFEVHASLFLESCREIAYRIALRDGEVTADQVRTVFEQRHKSTMWLGRAAGAIFRDRRFRSTGRSVQSTHPSRQAGKVTVWELR